MSLASVRTGPRPSFGFASRTPLVPGAGGPADQLDASYRRVVLRHRRTRLRVAAVVALVVSTASLVSRLVVDPSPAVLALSGLSVALMGALVIAVPRLSARRLWLAATVFGLGGVATPAAALVLERPENALYAIGTVGLVPIALAVFATWGFASQVRWSIGSAVFLVGVTLLTGHDDTMRILPAFWRAFVIGTGFGLAAAYLFEVARVTLHRTARIAHARRAELIGANRRAQRVLAQMQAVESICTTLTAQGATPVALELVMGILYEDFGYSHPSIYLGDASGVRLGAQRGYDTPVGEIAAGEWVIGRALRNDAVQLVADVRRDPDYRAASTEVRSQIAVPLRAEGRIIGILNVENRDMLDDSDVASITVVADRIAIALDLAERHHTLQSIVDGTPLAIVAYDRNQDVRFWGAGAERMFGWTAAEVRGRRSPFLPTIDVDRDPAVQAIVAGDRIDGVEAERSDRHGRRIPVRIFAAPFHGVPGSGHVVAYQDLTTEHRTATALAESEARYESLVESLHEGIVLQSADGAIVASNPAAERILGLTQDQLTGLTSYDPRWRATHEDGSDFAGADHPATVALATGKPVIGVTMGVHKPTGELAWVSVDAMPLKPGASPKGGVVVSFSDITDRLRLQSELLQAQKMDSVGRLAGGIAHDFNNLLTAILGNSQMLAPIVEGEAAEHVDEIQRAGERAAVLTRQLLGFARKTMLDPGDHELNAIVSDMEPMIRRLVGAHIAVVTRLDPAVGHVRVDRSQMDQVLLNLAVNARDAMTDGGVLSIETSVLPGSALDPGIVIAAERVAILTVRDSGIGMDENVRRQAFDPFYTTKPRGHGTGLGLATTHGIVVQSGGAITVDSMPGDGSSFAIYLPEVQPVTAIVRPIQRVVAPPGVGTILLVEDEEAVREVARRILVRAGYRVLHAPNANAAMSVIGSGLEEIDLLVSDVVMPGMRGPEMYEILRRTAPELPAIFVSGYADLADNTESLPVGSRFLAKPYDPTDLIEIVQAALAVPTG